jgi:hypothetical protein
VRSHFSHVSGLHRATEPSPQLVGTGFDHRVVRDANDRAVCAIQGHRNPGGLLKQLIQLFLKRRCRFIHESASAWNMTGYLDHQAAALYHGIYRFSY